MEIVKKIIDRPSEASNMEIISLLREIKKELVIENSRHIYTKDYIELVKEFYLKM